MELLLEDLLEFMDKKYPKEVFCHELFEHFSVELVKSSYEQEFIDNSTPNYKGTGIMGTGKGQGLVLTADGFLALNQIRIKKTTEKLNNSIVQFDKSSAEASERMINLTVWIKWLTIALTGMGIIQIFLIFKQLKQLGLF